MKTYFTLLLLALSPIGLPGQTAKVSEESAAKQLSKPKVPANLDEAHQELLTWFEPEELARIKKMPEKYSIISDFLEVRMDLHSIWGLGRETPMSKFFREKGLTNEDDMSALILETFWLKQAGKKFDLDTVVADYKLFRLEHTWPDDSILDPADQSTISWYSSLGAKGRPHRRIYVGRSDKTDRELAYEHGKGLYEPGEEIAELNRQFEEELAETLPEGFNETYNVPAEQYEMGDVFEEAEEEENGEEAKQDEQEAEPSKPE